LAFKTDAARTDEDSLATIGASGAGRAVKRGAAWPYAVPAFIAIAVTLGYPLGYDAWISMQVDRLSANDGQFVGLANYQAIWTQGQLFGTVGRTLVFTFGSLIAGLVVGFGSALALEAFPRASRVIRPLLLTPWVIPGVAVAAVWLSILDPLTGLGNRLLGLLGIAPVGWLSTPASAMLCLIVVNTWKGSPFMTLMLSAGLKSIPKETLEAGRIDGASYFQIVWHIILPALRPVLSVTTVLGFIWTFNYFDLAYLLTDGGPDGATTTLPYAIWQSSIRFNRFDEGAAFSVLSILLTGIAVVFYLRASRKQRQA
jgi:ABC-type sugar transport system permease subunit